MFDPKTSPYLHTQPTTTAAADLRPASTPAPAASPLDPSSQAFRSRPPADVRVLVVGPTGYIGRFVTKELIARGYQTVALAREKAGVKGKLSADDTRRDLEGATCVFGEVSDGEALARVFKDHGPFDAVVSCLASRTGGVRDSWAIDYGATKAVLDAARAAGTSHFVLLSAICVQKPLLEFQRAKLELEAALAANADAVTYSIVRPTAFFKSLAGQVELVKKGQPYVMFGDGDLAACKPISEADLAAFIVDAVQDSSLANRVLPIGGPGPAWTAREQGELLFKLAGKPQKFIRAPVKLFDIIIGALDGLAKLFPGLVDAAEFGRIGKYYATESMLVWNPTTQQYDADATPSYGKDTLEAFFERALQDGGMEGQDLGDAAIF